MLPMTFTTTFPQNILSFWFKVHRKYLPDCPAYTHLRTQASLGPSDAIRLSRPILLTWINLDPGMDK